MLLGLNVLDWVLIVLVALFVLSGWRKSFLVALGGIVGVLAGATAAFFAVPVVSVWVKDPTWRIVALVLVFVALLAIGHGLGEALAARIRNWMDMPRPRWWGRAGGALIHLAVSAFVISGLAFTFSALGLPALSTQIADSKMVAGSRAVTPAPVQRALGQARSLVAGLPLPELLTPPTTHEDVTVPAAPIVTPSIQAARQSVARITGTAEECGVNQTGTSFVIAQDRVITNAHVVAGVDRPVVETADGRALTGRVVSFDPVRDVAVVAVDGLDLPALRLGGDLSTGDTAEFMGFPAGGPFTSLPAAVQSERTVSVPNIYGQKASALQIYQLAADVQQGNSGGPLLDADGRVTGMVFAKAKDRADVGYALTLDELRAAVRQAPSRSQAVSSGSCTTH